MSKSMDNTGIVCMGALIMDMFPTETGKRLAEVSAYRPTPGGAPANVAVAAARLGVRSAFIGKVGDDAFGHHLVEVLNKEGVDTRGIRFDKKVRTTANFHAISEEGLLELLFYRNPGADTTLNTDELDLELIRNAKVLHFDSLCLTDEPTRSTTFKAVETAAESDVIISFDMNYRSALWEDPSKAVECVNNTIEKVDILKLNTDELNLICPKASVEAAAESLLEKGPKLCLVTLGEKGSYFRTKMSGKLVPTINVNVKDTVGCGDAFIGGFLSCIIKGGCKLDEISDWKLEEYVKYANTVASLTATRQGALPALPTREEVDKYFRK